MNILENRKDNDTPIFRAFVERTLKQHAEKMNDRQRRKMTGFNSPIWNRRQISTNDKSLFLTHPAPERFVDMKRRYVKSKGRQIPKKFHEVHNRIIMGHYNGIMMDLTYGLTEEVKEQIREQFHNKKI